MSFIVGCSSDDDQVGLNYVAFGLDEHLDVQEFSSASLDIGVYTGNITGSDRTFSISVDTASTISPESYTVPETVTVPANSNEATINVEVTDTNLPVSGELILNLEQEEGFFTGDPLVINTSKICEFDPVGSYVNDSGFHEAEVPVEIEAGAAAGEYIARDLFEDGTDITFTVDENWAVTVASQDAFVSEEFGQVSVEGTGSIAPCTHILTLNVEHTAEGEEEGSVESLGSYTEVLTQQTGTEDGPE